MQLKGTLRVHPFTGPNNGSVGTTERFCAANNFYFQPGQVFVTERNEVEVIITFPVSLLRRTCYVFHCIVAANFVIRGALKILTLKFFCQR